MTERRFSLSSLLHLPRLFVHRLAVTALVLYFIGGVVFLGVRYGVLPKVPAYRVEVAQMLSRSLGRPVEIGSLSADWSGLHPSFRLGGLTIKDAAGRPALTLEHVEAEPAWVSLLLMRLRLNRLEIDGPELAIRREADGQIFVAGLAIQSDGGQGDFAQWLFDQRSIVIRDARLTWRDALRGAEELALDKLEFRLDNSGSRHRFGLTAQPPARLAAALDVRGDLRGSDPAKPAEWRGELYAGLDYADLGAWRQWVDYPLAVEGAGGVRAWLEFGDGHLSGLTADFAVKDARVQLGKRLEEIPLTRAAGRVRYRDENGVVEASGRQLSLQTRDGLSLEPTDFFLSLRERSGSSPARGEFVANRLELAVLSELAGRLPFDPAFRARLADLEPVGSVAPVNVKWTTDAGRLATYSVDARFAGLGINPVGAWPGFSGLSGQVQGSERGGRFGLTGKNASLDLPQIFPQSHVAFAELAADGGWTQPDGRLEISLANVSFANRDTRGTASGRYRAQIDAPGEIDLQARLSDADARAVWRYIPTVVGKEARDWLAHSLTGGRAQDARLVLKGELAKFPFRNPRDGTFRVTARVSDGQLDYAPGWPRIEGISGDLLFEGAGMRINAQRGRILGAELKDVTAVLPDFETDSTLTVHGSAHGPTQEFLHFIAQSPVAESINHFTDPFQVEGNGALDLHLTLPLRKLADSKVRGEYVFSRNQLQVAAGMPVFAEAAARVGFTESQLTVKGGTTRVFGEPVSVAGGTRPDGSVVLNAQGTLGMAALRQALDLPLLDHLSGTAAWKGAVTVPRRGGVEFVLDSNLQGVTSNLPEPLAKAAAASLPFRFELAVPAADSDVIRLAAGAMFQAQFQRHHEGGRALITRGGIALNEPVRLADRGVLVAANADKLDADAWRKALAGNAERKTPPAGAAGGDEASAFPLSGLALRAGELHMLGQRLNDVNLRAVMEEGGWQARLSSKEATGDFVWRDQGRGRLQARFRQLSLGSSGAESSGDGGHPDEERLSELPGLDVIADSFVLRGHQLGRLDLKAANRGDLWRLEQLTVSNPDGTLSGKGVWRPGAKEETRLNFKLDVTNIERMLSRLGYPEAVRRGKGELEGELVWRGPPTALHIPSLGGKMNVKAENGQFAQLEPGVGRLLGVLSLQALPRRITLDFRDVFSEGFAFDRISGSIQMNNGVLRTEDLEITGPAARVFMRGEADAGRETQNLHVRVQPTLSESVAVGSAIATTGVIHPAIGLAAYLVQKALRDPVEKLFSFEYAVTGGWSDPKVEKLATRPSAPILPSPLP